MHKTVTKKVLSILHYLEVVLAVLAIMAVLIGTYFFLGQLLEIAGTSAIDVRLMIESLLADLLILVVGVELAILLIKRTPESLIEIIFFVIARKLIIKGDNMMELFLGVAAIAGLFAIQKYLMNSGQKLGNEL